MKILSLEFSRLVETDAKPLTDAKRGVEPGYSGAAQAGTRMESLMP